MASAIFIPDIVVENGQGIFANNASKASLPVLAALTSAERLERHNVVRQELVIVGCANLKEHNFRFDSSVVLPVAREGFKALGALIRRHPGAPMTLFGHADPVGSITYNQFLSERRARAVFAVMVRDVSIWESLFTNKQQALGDEWGASALDEMVKALGLPAGSSTGGAIATQTQKSIRQLLGLAAGAAVSNAAVRQALFARYMDFLRDGLPPETPPFPSLAPNDFLGRGKQKATLQGCSVFNPQFLMSQAEHDAFAKDKSPESLEARNARNEPNRRVMIFLFTAGTTIDPALWPCPSATEGPGKCERRQWSNGKDRRSKLFVNHARRYGREVPESARELAPRNLKLENQLGREETTFGCRFYHGIALHSPCERDLKLWVLRLMVDAPTLVTPGVARTRAKQVPLAGRRFVAVLGTSQDAPTIRGTTTANGFIALPFFDPNIRIQLKIDAFASLVPPTPRREGADTSDSQRFDDEDQFVPFRLDGSKLRAIRVRDKGSLAFDPDFDAEPEPLTDADRRLGALQRLYNLGYGSDDTGGDAFGNWTGADRRSFLIQFQKDHGLQENGQLDQPTTDALFREHGS